MKSLHDLVQVLREQRQTVGFAESCTGGLLSSLLTEHAGISDIFIGSVVSYSNQVKMDLLGVQSSSLSAYGAVSERVALEMAQGIIRHLKTSTSIAITGIAGPSGGSAQKPVGTVCFAVCGPHFEEVQTRSFSGDRKSIQTQACEFGYQFLLSQLQRKN